jgi:hypothetical protein
MSPKKSSPTKRKDPNADRLITFYASPNLVDEFDRVAASSGRSRSSLLRRLMEQAVARPSSTRG